MHTTRMSCILTIQYDVDRFDYNMRAKIRTKTLIYSHVCVYARVWIINIFFVQSNCLNPQP